MWKPHGVPQDLPTWWGSLSIFLSVRLFQVGPQKILWTRCFLLASQGFQLGYQGGVKEVLFMQPLHSGWARPPMLPGADSCRAPSVLITPVAAALSCSLFLCMDSPPSAKDFKGNSCIDVCPPTPSLSCSLLSAALPCRDRLFRLH